jgi:hypothetical protein
MGNRPRLDAIQESAIENESKAIPQASQIIETPSNETSVVEIVTEVKKEEIEDPAPEAALVAEVKTEEVRQRAIRARIYGQW